MSLTYDWKIRKIKKYPSKIVNYESGDVEFTDYICYIEGRIRVYEEEKYDSEDKNTFIEKDFYLNWETKPQDPPESESQYISFENLKEEDYINIVKNSKIYSNLESIVKEKYIAKFGNGPVAEIENPFGHEEFDEYDPTDKEMEKYNESLESETPTDP